MTDQAYTNDKQFCEMIKLVGDSWTAMILSYLEDGPKRFSDIKCRCGINTKTLTQRLVDLETAQVISKREYQEYPPRTEYAITERGKGILPAYKILLEWVNKYTSPDHITTD